MTVRDPWTGWEFSAHPAALKRRSNRVENTSMLYPRFAKEASVWLWCPFICLSGLGCVVKCLYFRRRQAGAFEIRCKSEPLFHRSCLLHLDVFDRTPLFSRKAIKLQGISNFSKSQVMTPKGAFEKKKKRENSFSFLPVHRPS